MSNFLQIQYSKNKNEVTAMSLALGNRIRALRRLKRMTQLQLAEQLGISVSQVSVIERGLKRPSAEQLEKIAAALNVSREEFS